jgi:hypothetical protein
MKIKIIVVVVFIIFFINIIDAISIGGIYSMDYPLELSPGENKVITFSLQNRAGDKDVKFIGEVVEGSEIVNFKDKNREYFVEGSSDSEVLVDVLVDIPKNAKIGEEYDIKLEFKPLPIEGQEEGMVQLSVRLSRYFKVNVVKEGELSEESIEDLGKNWFWILLGIIIVIISVIIIKFILGRRNEETNNLKNYEYA